MYDESPFISSCTRRQLAQRRPARVAPRLPIPVVIALLALLLALAALLLAPGGI